MGLLDSGPYANYDPRKDPYLKNRKAPTLTVGGPGLLNSPVANAAKIMAADLGGMAGDALELTGGPNIFPTSDEVAGAMGADRMTPSGLLGTVAGPGPAEFKGLLGAAKKLLVGGGAGGLLNAMTLFHGTPHKFDMFDLSKIGTGEGAQAYGHGLYFAENPGVASSYRSRLSRAGSANSLTDEVHLLTVGDEKLVKKYPIEDDRDFVNLINDGNKTGASNYAQSRIDRWTKLKNDPTYQFRDYAAEKADAWSRLKPEIDAGRVENPSLGHLYEVDIPDETVGKMLDWDAPLSEQPESVRKALEGTPIEKWATYWAKGKEPTGKDIQSVAATLSSESMQTPGLRRALQGDFYSGEHTGQAGASEYLKSLGIPGIRFLDGSSRKAGEGTRNIVVFDPNDIRQVKRDGELVYKTKGL